MSLALLEQAAATLRELESEGLAKRERPILSPQSSEIRVDVDGERTLLNLCANNYLGLADDARLIAAAKRALDSHGLGMASVRFICGTQDLHRALEHRVAEFLGTEDAILFSSCFDANAGFFEAVLGPEDAILSDQLNHACIIDGIRLCKARRFRYANGDMDELEARLNEAGDARNRIIVTDGVFSMDGISADLPRICELAERFDALVMVDDSHATGLLGARGAGTPEALGVEGRVQILTGTFGKALGGASGGYVAGPASIVGLLRQRARPYLFSNALAPPICAATLAAIDIAEAGGELRERLRDNARRFRDGMSAAGFELVAGNHPIIPVMTRDPHLAQALASGLMEEGIYVTAFSHPVVPRGQDRVRTQMSAAHMPEQLDRAVEAFTKVGRRIGLVD